MTRSPIITGIDIGTYHVKVVVVECPHGSRSFPHIIGWGLAESRGLRHGYIINSRDVSRAVKSALRAAEKMAGVAIKRAYLSVGGVGLESVVAQGGVIVSRADLEITELDVQHVLEASEQAIPQASSLNRKVVHAIPLTYLIDGKETLGRPVGMKGARFEVKTLFVMALEHHLNDLIQSVEDAGVEVLDVMASPIAASLVTLTHAQKIAGCVLANIGAETVSVVVFENNVPISLQVFPIGGTDITNDIALGLQIPLEEAEGIKRGALTGSPVPKKKLEEIITARLSDIFELIEAHLKRIGRNGLLPAGIIITGGSSGISTIEDLAKASLRLPSRIGIPNLSANTKGEIKESSWSVAYGLCVWGCSAGEEESMGIRIAKQTRSKLTEWVKQFLP